jgi:AraC-like DNA-binding protein/mannose-6-phosphate isomerase-like protein (cupin superfamily)
MLPLDARQPKRSTDPDDYQAVPRPVAGMAKPFPSGFEIAPHEHARDQLLYAVAGVMRIETETEAWMVPPDRAVYLPAGTRHRVVIRGDLEMRTLYIAAGEPAGLPQRPTVIEVSELLRALILALIEEPVLYDEAGRGGLIARLILAELTLARRLPLVVPMPMDPRLRRLCDALLANPESESTLEDRAMAAGASARTLARLFQSELNMGFAVWRQRVRFHNAIEALAAGQPIAKVAHANGYRSASAFSAAFRKAMGAPPSAIRIASPS